MRQQRSGLFWGIAFITFGLLFFARNLGWLNIDWSVVRNLWPLLLILAGLNLLLQRQGRGAAVFTTTLLAIAVPFALFGFLGRDRNWHNNRYEYRYENDDESTESDEEAKNNEDEYQSERDNRVETRSDNFVEAMTPGIRTATLKLEGGAARFRIGEPTDQLIQANTRMSVGSYSMSVERSGDAPVIELSPNEGKVRLHDGEIDNRVEVRLNAQPAWDVEVDMGAGTGNFDLSRYVVERVDIEAGAADIDLTLGNRAEQTDVKVSSGVASITIRVPKGVGCRIEKDGAFNLNELDDFTKVEDGSYVTPGYNAAAKKIAIRYEGGMSKFKVERY